MSLIEDRPTQEEKIKEDFEWLKNELEGLTKAERRIIINEYVDQSGSYGVGVREYQSFIKMLEGLEEG